MNHLVGNINVYFPCSYNRIEAKGSRGNKQREIEWEQAKDRTTQANNNTSLGVTVCVLLNPCMSILETPTAKKKLQLPTGSELINYHPCPQHSAAPMWESTSSFLSSPRENKNKSLLNWNITSLLCCASAPSSHTGQRHNSENLKSQFFQNNQSSRSRIPWKLDIHF